MKSEQHETNVALHSPKTWKAGTLVYTSAGLAMLFFWLLWGDFTWAMKDRAVGPSATLLIKQIGVSDFLYALIVIAFPLSVGPSPRSAWTPDSVSGVYDAVHRAGTLRARIDAVARGETA